MRSWIGVFCFALCAFSLSAVAGPLDDLFGAVSIDDLRDVRRLVQDGVVDPNATDAKGDTALIAAIRSDAQRVSEYLIANKKVDVDRTNASLETPMMIAAYRSRKDVVEKLIARGAEVNRTGWTALHYAASAGSVDIVKLLLEHAAYIDAESPNKTTPLMMAARSNHADVCHLLIDEGADPTPVNERDLTAADFATRAGDTELAQWLGARADAWRAKYGSSSKRGTKQ
jgi:uncharacterized protein